MIDRDAIAQMEQKPFLVNVGRGPLIDEQALISGLEEGRLKGAALDVYEVEPLPEDSPLKDFENIILGSHNANNMASANQYVNQNTLKNLFDELVEVQGEMDEES